MAIDVEQLISIDNLLGIMSLVGYKFMASNLEVKYGPFRYSYNDKPRTIKKMMIQSDGSSSTETYRGSSSSDPESRTATLKFVAGEDSMYKISVVISSSSAKSTNTGNVTLSTSNDTTTFTGSFNYSYGMTNGSVIVDTFVRLKAGETLTVVDNQTDGYSGSDDSDDYHILKVIRII